MSTIIEATKMFIREEKRKRRKRKYYQLNNIFPNLRYDRHNEKCYSIDNILEKLKNFKKKGSNTIIIDSTICFIYAEHIFPQ